MFVKKDSYREKQVRIMLSHETSDPVACNANLSHSGTDSKPINVESNALAVLADAYAGKYIEVNDDTMTPLSDVRFRFWMHYEYEDEEYPLLFVWLPHLNNRDVVRLLREFNQLYGSTNQETTEWALEYQVLTRLLIHDKCLLVNPKYLNISMVLDSILKLIPDEDRPEYLKAREIPQETIREMFQEEN